MVYSSIFKKANAFFEKENTIIFKMFCFFKKKDLLFKKVVFLLSWVIALAVCLKNNLMT